MTDKLMKWYGKHQLKITISLAIPMLLAICIYLGYIALTQPKVLLFIIIVFITVGGLTIGLVILPDALERRDQAKKRN